MKSIPCTYMRAGTSKGPFFDLRDLPESIEERDRALLTVMGSPDLRQVNYTDGDLAIDGVPGTGSPILMNLFDPTGGTTGHLFPMGSFEGPERWHDQITVHDAMGAPSYPCGNRSRLHLGRWQGERDRGVGFG